MPMNNEQPLALQGIQSPNVVVDPNAFYAATRKLTYPMQSARAIAGLGSSDSVELRKTGVVSGLLVRVSGTLVFGGTITGTSLSYRFPYNIIRALRVSANGQSNLINCSGLMLKAMEFAANTDLNDRGVSRAVAAGTQLQGTLSKACENWGAVGAGAQALGPGAAVPAIGTYDVELDYFVPIAADQTSLIGSIFAQTAATNLTLDIDWAQQADIVTLGGSATLTNPATTLNWQVTGVVYSIPVVSGKAVVPDLSQFHQLAQFRTSALAQNDNQILLPGTGVGRNLMRVLGMITTGATPVPLAVTATNYGQFAWQYGGNDTPESYPNGQVMRSRIEQQWGVDAGRFWGLWGWDFVSEFAVRDIVNEGSTSDLRLLINLAAAPTAPFAEILQETLFAAPVGA